MIRPFACSIGVLCLAALTAAGDSLEEGFLNPPRSAKPHTWYHMMNGNITKEGLTRDFEELAKVGIGGVQMFDAGCDIPPGGLEFNTPAWFDMFSHAAREARRLGLEICIPNCSGWSSSGGPWNMPSNAMKVVTWRSVPAHGPTRFHAKLPREEKDNGYYADIAVLAFPTPKDELTRFDGVRTVITSNAFSLVSDRLFAVRGFSYRIDFQWCWDADATFEIEVSEDGRTFRPVSKDKVPMARSGGVDYTWRYHPLPEVMNVRELRVRAVRSPSKFVFKDARPERTLKMTNVKRKTFAIRHAFAGFGSALADTFTATPDQLVEHARVLDLTDRLAKDGTLDWVVPDGDWTILRVGAVCNGKRNHPASKRGCGLEVDKLSAEAMDYHFEQYVARLCKTLGSFAGAVETGFNNILVDSFEVGPQNWTQKMEGEFLKRRGYSIRPYLPAFAGYPVDSVAATERFFEDFRRVVADLFAENYAGALAKKCHQYGLKLSLEPYGNSPSDDLQYGEYCDIPMCEFWSQGANPYAVGCGLGRQVANVTHVWGKRICGAEAFTANPARKAGRWMTTPFLIKALGDCSFSDGVNRIIYHRYTHQPWADDRYLPGMTMGRWGMHFDRTQTWWKHVKPWLTYQTRCQYLLQRGTFCADVLFFSGESTPKHDLNVDCPGGFNRDICPTDAMYALKVENGRLVVPGGVRYRLLVLPSDEAMSPEMLKCVIRLRKAGANVLLAGKPVRAPGLKWGAEGDAEVRRLVEELVSLGALTGTTADALKKLGVTPDLAILSSDGPKDGFSWIHRGDDAADWYFTALPARKETTVEISFRQAGRVPELWDAEKGTVRPADVWREEGGRTIVKVPYTISGSMFVVFRRPAKASDRRTVTKRAETRASAAVDGPWSVEFPAGYLPNPLASGPVEKVTFDRLISWPTSENVGVRYFSGSATYRKTLALPAARPANARLFLDLGDVRDFAVVKVNDVRYPVLWKPPFRLDITEAVPAGAKTAQLEIEVTNLWANRLIGDDIEHAEDCEWRGSVQNGVKEIGIRKIPDWVKKGEKSPTGRCTFTTWKHWDKKDDLLPSGLIGPVCLQTVVYVE